jgi:protein-disulfide isomerase
VTKTLKPLESEREPLLSRRVMLAAAVLATGGLAASWVASLFRPARTQAAARQKMRPGADEIAKSGPLPDLVIGNPDAPVTIVEYASMTCPHCANFHNKVLPELKKKYIDTGKAKLVFREYLLDERGALAAMVARCAGEGKALPLVSALFAKQDEWVPAKGNFLAKLFGFAQQVGITRQAFDECRKDKALLDSLVAQTKRGASLGVNSTPTFFVNGKKVAGATLEDFDKAIAPVLKQ